MNPNKNGKRTITFNHSSTFNHLFNQNISTNQKSSVDNPEYYIEKMHKKNMSAFKTSINSLIKYDYAQCHIYPDQEYAAKPNNVNYNTLINYHSKSNLNPSDD